MPVRDPSDPGSGGNPGGGGSATPAQGGDGSEIVVADGNQSRFSEVALSSGLIESISGVVPTFVASAVTSPFVVVEILLRALGRTAAGLLIPIGLTLLFGLLLFWRLRPEDEEWESDVFPEAPLDLPGGVS